MRDLTAVNLGRLYKCLEVQRSRSVFQIELLLVPGRWMMHGTGSLARSSAVQHLTSWHCL